MKIETYLVFNGDCREALEFYQAVLGGSIVTMLTHRESPAKQFVPAEWQDKILHARLEVDGYALLASDAPPEHQVPAGGYYVSLTLDTEAKAEQIFAALSDSGKPIVMPMQETFWAKRFGMCTDRFGTQWMVSSAE